MQLSKLTIALAGLLAANVQAAPATPGTKHTPIATHCGPSTYLNYISASLVDDCQKMLDNLVPDAGGGGVDGQGRGDQDWAIVGEGLRVIGNYSTCAFGCHTSPDWAVSMLGIEDVRRVVRDSIAKFKHASDGEGEKLGAQGDFACEYFDATISWTIYNPLKPETVPGGPGGGPTNGGR
ncbi:hypothetical protein B0T21DRAFT_441642, partial [Apiosordaria backusii]